MKKNKIIRFQQNHNDNPIRIETKIITKITYGIILSTYLLIFQTNISGTVVVTLKFVTNNLFSISTNP